MYFLVTIADLSFLPSGLHSFRYPCSYGVGIVGIFLFCTCLQFVLWHTFFCKIISYHILALQISMCVILVRPNVAYFSIWTHPYSSRNELTGENIRKQILRFRPTIKQTRKYCFKAKLLNLHRTILRKPDT